MITFITESCFPEAYSHHKCPMGSSLQWGKSMYSLGDHSSKCHECNDWQAPRCIKSSLFTSYKFSPSDGLNVRDITTRMCDLDTLWQWMAFVRVPLTQVPLGTSLSAWALIIVISLTDVSVQSSPLLLYKTLQILQASNRSHSELKCNVLN